MITIKSNKRSYGINFPTDVKEITPEVLNTLTDSIKLPKHYCIVALAFNTKLFDFCTAINSSRDANIAVTPLLAKISQEDSEQVNAGVGDKIIIDRSSLERGSHLHIKTMINSTVARNYFNSDQELIKSIITNNKSGESNNIGQVRSSNIIVLEFKICPVTDIAAAIPMNYESIDPFIYKDNSIN